MTLFSIQRDLEDLLNNRRLDDADQYAVRVAAAAPRSSSKDDLLTKMSKMRTVFFTRNRSIDRRSFENEIADRIWRKFGLQTEVEIFPGGLSMARSRVQRQRRLRIAVLLQEFKHSIESKSIPHFWESRSKGKLRKKPESIAELAITQFLSAVIAISNRGFVIRQLASGVGFLDVAVVLSSVLHLIELKVLTTKFTGAEQLEKYMRAERRKVGWLVIFDARKPEDKTDIPAKLTRTAGTISVVVIDINPATPSSFSK